MPTSMLAFIVKLTNASDRHLNLLSIDIRSIQTSLTMNISIFFTIADNQIDGQNNESEVEVNAFGYPVQNTAEISKLIYRYNKLLVFGRQSTFIFTYISLLQLLCCVTYLPYTFLYTLNNLRL